MLAVPAVVSLVLAGCAAVPTVDPGDRDACIDWATYEQGMLQTVAVIQEISKDPAKLTEDIATEFNTARNNLLVAYDSAVKTATSEKIKNALSNALDADSVIYFDLSGATDQRIQESIVAINAVVTACSEAGVDLSTILGNSN